MLDKLDYLVPVGLFKKTRKYIAGHVSLRSMLGFCFNLMHVPYAEQCCSTNDSVPVRYNVALGHLEYYDAPSNTWIHAPTV